ncbi:MULTISPECIES: trypsin-like serine protease [Klebsiella]|uniref:trypsin-like serine protease n=1 Tax=Klebsiella TaxID=570 RepID=UPI0024792026|nr:trypsin-like serine protease [Klebsiella quasivariicola]
MFENYVCKIYVSSHPNFSTPLEATAFGYDDGGMLKILTAAHVVTNALGMNYPVSNTQELYVKFHNHYGPVNVAPVPVDFILNDSNDIQDFDGITPFVDSAEIVLPTEIQQPVSSYFKGRSPATAMDTLGVGYPLGKTTISTFPGKVSSIWPSGCTNHYPHHHTTRFVIAHYNTEGCSGGPYIVSEGDEYFVIGSLIGIMSGTSPDSNPQMSVQSATDF